MMAILKDMKENTPVSPSIKEDSLLHDMNAQSPNNTKKYIILGIIVIVLGILTGFLIPKNGSSIVSSSGNASSAGSGQKIYGSEDTSVFKDKAEGTLQKGGIDGEGTHKLIRPGGDSQTVYITSTVLDINQFVGKKVRVWGQTHSAQKAGWLMDVGRVEIIQ